MVEPIATATERDSLWAPVVAGAERIGDQAYAEFVTRQPFGWYRDRVRAMGLTGYGSVLDIGCGYGHWSAALALENGHVTAAEVHPGRLAITSDLAAHLALDNVTAATANILALPWPDQSFDVVFCYGVAMLTNRELALSELERVLRPGGKLYACLNGPGWWLDLALKHRKTNKALARLSWRTLRRGHDGTRAPNWMTLDDVRTRYAGPDWAGVRAGAEGELGGLGGAYPSRPHGLDHVIEFVATKAGALPRAVDGVTARVQAVVAEVLTPGPARPGQRDARLPMPKPVVDLVLNRPKAGLDLLISDVMTVDRVGLLKAIWQDITAQSSTEREKVLAAVTFAQRRFHHHFAGQPMLSDSRALTDPVMALLFGACRCGNAARFLVDLLLVNGIEARLVLLACHTAAEAYFDGAWRLIDASLYPPGRWPVGSDGLVLTLEEAIASPDLLNAPPNYLNYDHSLIADFRTAYPEAYLPIAHWLERPILPSSGYFGVAFQETPGRSIVRRYAKFGEPAWWNSRDDFGWEEMRLAETLDAAPLPTEQRPGQVQVLACADDQLVWQAPAGDDPEQLTYELWLQPGPRGWSLDSLQSGQVIEPPPGTQILQIKDTRFSPVPDQATHVTIIARHDSYAGRDVFFLPSREFEIRAS